MRKSSFALLTIAMAVAASAGAVAQGAPPFAGMSNNLSARSQSSAAGNAIQLNAPEQGGFRVGDTMSNSGLAASLGGSDRPNRTTSASIGEGAAPATPDDKKPLAGVHASGSLSGALRRRTTSDSVAASLSEGNDRLDTVNTGAVLGGNPLSGLGATVRAGNDFSNKLTQ